MESRLFTLELKKLFPLTISRGTSTGSTNLYVELTRSGQTGLGECAPGTGDDDGLAGRAKAQAEALCAYASQNPNPHDVWQHGEAEGIEEPVRAAVDIALWDLFAKEAGKPLYALLGLPRRSVPTSVTIGINPPDVVRERVPEILRLWQGKRLKVKLGGKGGIEADKERYLAAKEASEPFGVTLRIDANGGWDVDGAAEMMRWLAEQGCDYVEQPLERGREVDLPRLFEGRPLPLYLDESVRTKEDVPKVADRCDGVNLKLMKTGGITEAMRLIGTARACNLQTMIGCMGESSVSIAAGAAIGALFDHIDLDAHFNLDPDPATGLDFEDGAVLPPDRPGHGVSLN